MESSILIKKENKSGQVWSLDIVIAGVIITIGIVVLYLYAINYTNQSQEKLEYLFYEGNLAAELILSEEDFGILNSEGKVNQTKLDGYYFDYNLKRAQLGISRNFYFNISGLTKVNVSGSLVDVPYIGNQSANPESSIKITRITIYENKPTRLDLYVWE
jgi:hypothetical protein